MTNETAQQTKQTIHDVQLPAVARQRLGYGEAWYFERDGELVAHQGDQRAEGDNAWTMLKWDLEDDQAALEDGLSPEDLPTDFKPVAADGGER